MQGTKIPKAIKAEENVEKLKAKHLSLVLAKHPADPAVAVVGVVVVAVADGVPAAFCPSLRARVPWKDRETTVTFCC